MAYRQPRKKTGSSGGGAVKRPKKKKNSAPVNRDPWNDGWALDSELVGFSRGRWRLAKILHRKNRRPTADNAHTFEYYVHYHELNRRMDEWVGWNRLLTHKQYVDEEGEEALQELKSRVIAATHDEESSTPKPAHGVPAVSRSHQARVGAALGDTIEFIEEGHDGMTPDAIKEHENLTKVKNVQQIELGRYRMETWYFSPYPETLFPNNDVTSPLDILYIDEYSLDFFRRKSEMVRHQRKAGPRHPPGDEIYRCDEYKVAMFEVDGAKQQRYCENLAYIGKLFLDHKTLSHSVKPFLFYVLCEFDERGYHVVGYYSKEKQCEDGYNLACILTLPCYQRKGYGRFLIAFSYELSKKERKVGSPEKPLSDLGLVSYRSYWSSIILEFLAEWDRPTVSITDIMRGTSFTLSDIVSTMQYLGLIKYWNGQYVITVSPQLVKELRGKMKRKTITPVYPEKLHWAPLKVDVKRDKWTIASKLKLKDDDPFVQ